MKNIVLSCDENYILPTRVMLRSMAQNDHEGDWKVWFIYSDISTEAFEPVQKDVESYGWEFEARKLDQQYENLFDGFPVTFHFAKEMYYRLLLPWILSECDRILYLDSDVLVRADLTPLYQTDLKENLMAAVMDADEEARQCRKEQLHLKGSYYYSGMHILDAKSTREWNTVEEFLQKILDIQSTVKLEYPDQDLLNILYDEKILTLDERYNFAAPRNLVKNFFRPKLRREVVIAHFVSLPKPWQKHYKGFYLREYRRYLKEFQR